MKKIFALSLLAAWSLSMSSCKDDFEIAAPYKPITIVYGLLSQNDTAHYMRIQKAFLDGNKSAIVMSKVADSNYWKNLDVVVREMSGTTVLANIPLSKVDLSTEGYVKQPGDSLSFFTTPSYAYKFKRNLNAAYRYRLVVKNNETGAIDSAETPIINKNFTCPTLDIVTLTLDFSRPDLNMNFLIQLSSDEVNTRFYQAMIRFHYVDKNNATGVQTDRSVDFRLPNTLVVSSGQSNEIKTAHKSFYSFLGNAIPASDGSISRYMDSAEIFVYAGGYTLYDYIIISQNQSVGLTSDQIQPRYTNIKGVNALGLLSTRAYRTKGQVGISVRTLDSIMANPETANLNFKGFSDH